MSMTESEAIRRLKDHFRVHNDGRPTPYLDEAVSMAIQALEKVQALKENKTYHLYREYLSIGTVSEFRELKEKATAKKPIETEEFTEGGWIGKCPTCGSDCNDAMNYCDQCGQRLLWE